MKINRQTIFKKTNGRCAYCGCEVNKFQVDHIVAKSRFEQSIANKNVPTFLNHLTSKDINHIDNLVAACSVCNKWKSDFSLELFRNELQQQIKRLNNFSSNYRIAKKYGLVKELPKNIVFYFETIKPQ